MGEAPRRRRVGWGTILAALILVIYIAFELHVLTRSKHRTEPLFIHGQYVEARQATARCGDPDPAERADFERNFAAVTRRARADLAEKHPELAPEEIDARLSARARAVIDEVDALIEAKGCEDREVWMLVKRHELRSRLNLR